MIGADPQQCFETLRERVRAVGRLHRRCLLRGGAGLVAWRIGLPLLALVLLQRAIGLPFYLRAPILPLAAGLLGWWTWRHVIRPLRAGCSDTRSALLVEQRRPGLQSILVSAIELYPALQAGRAPDFDPDMVRAVVQRAQQSTQGEDLTAVIDRRPARRGLAAAAATLALWLILLGVDPAGTWQALRAMGTAWADIGQVMQKAGGARIQLDPLAQPAYLVGSDVHLRATQHGFHRPVMDLCLRPAGGGAWQRTAVRVDAQGRGAFTVTNVQESFELFFEAGMIASAPLTATVTERPRIVKMTVEYELPEYVHRAPIAQPNSDGNLQALFGSTVILTVEANKELESLRMRASFLEADEAFSVGGKFARGLLRLDLARWRENPDQPDHERYRLELRDGHGFVNADAGHDYTLEVLKDAPPRVHLVGLPHRSSAEEPHVLEENLERILPLVQASDDYGVKKITLYCRKEDLETSAERGVLHKERQFAMPVAEVPRLRVLSLADLGAKVGDRLIFWAEAEDGYNLDAEGGPHRARTEAFRIAIVSQEALFTDIRYNDTWSVDWYDKRKVAILSSRAAPPRMAPEREAAADVAARLLDTAPMVDTLRGADRQLVQDYYDSLNGER